MSTETICVLIKLAPTLLVVLFVVLSMLRGLIRGFRKSLILFIHYIVAFAIGLVLFIFVAKNVFSSDLNSLYQTIGGWIKVDLSNSHTFFEAVQEFLKVKAPNYAELVQNPYYQEIVVAIAGLVFNLVFGIICLFIIPFLLRGIFYVFYLLFYREGKHRRNIEEEGDEYHRRRGLGMLVGVLRGLTTSILLLSGISATYFIATGGISYEKPVDDVSITMLDSFDLDKYLGGYDVSKIYAAIKSSRKSGVGVVFDSIKINGDPIDYIISDLITSSSFTALRPDEEGNPVTATLCLRKESALLIGLLEQVLELDAVEIVKQEDGTLSYSIDFDSIESELEGIVDSTIANSQLLSDILPMAIVGTAVSIHDETLVLPIDLKAYFTEEVIEEIKGIDFAQDLSSIVSAAVKALEVVPLTEDGKFDLASLSNPNVYMNFDAEKIKMICKDLSEITLVTKAAAPVATAYFLSNYEQQLIDQGIDPDDIQPENIDWKDEVCNLGNVYEKAQALNLDYALLLGTSLSGTASETAYYLADEENNDASSSTLDAKTQYILDLCSDEAFRSKLLDLTDTIMDSNLLGQVSYIGVKYLLSKINFSSTDDSADSLNNVLNLVRDNLTSYTVTDLRADLHNLIGSCLQITSIIPMVLGGTTEPMKLLVDAPVADLRIALLGKAGDDTCGIYNLKLLNGVVDTAIVSLLKTYAKSIFTEEDIDGVTNWKTELGSLVDCVETIQEIAKDNPSIQEMKFDETILENFPTIADDSIDSLTQSMSKSLLLGGAIKNLVKKTIEDNQSVNQYITLDGITEDDWLDTNTKSGEINKLLKVFVVISEKGILKQTEDQTALVNGFKSLDDEDVDKFTNSLIITNSLTNIIKNVIPEDYKDKVSIPDDIVWANEYDSEHNLVKRGELSTVVQILNIEAFQDEEGNLKVDNLTDLNNFKKLSTVTLASDSKPCDVDLITNSRIFISVVDSFVGDALKEVSENAAMPEDASWANEYDTSHELVRVGELAAIVSILNIKAINVTSVDPDTSETVTKVDFNVLSDIDTIAQIIYYDESSEVVYDDAIALSKSAIVSSSMKDVVSKLSTDDITIVCPSSLEDYHSWQYDSSKNYQNGEIVKLCYVMFKTRNQVLTGENPATALTTDNLVSGLIGMENHSPITNSMILYATLSKYLVDYSTGDDPKLYIRQEAYVSDYDTAEIKLQRNEITLALDTLSEIGITDVNNISTQKVFDSISATDDTTRHMLCDSNILNITVVDKLLEADGTITIPDSLNTRNSAEWYPETEATWADCELNRVLLSVAELHEPNADGEASLTVGTDDSINVDTDILIKSLNDPAQSDASLEKVEVIYRSRVMQATVTAKINENAIGESPSLLIRDFAYEDSDRTKPIKMEEIVLLVDTLDQLDISDVNSVKAKNVLEKISATDNKTRQMLCNSNILNMTIVDKLISNSGDSLTLKGEYQTSSSDAWYPSDADISYDGSTTVWESCELNKILVSVAELQAENEEGNKGISISDEDAIDLDVNTTLYSLNDPSLSQPTVSKVEVIYESNVMADTITTKVNDYKKDNTIYIRDCAYMDNDSTKQLKSLEIKKLIDTLEDFGITDVNDVSTKVILEKVDEEVNRKSLCDSNILNITVVEKITASDGLVIPTELQSSEANGWYPESETNWSSCELNKLLLSVSELNIETDSEDNNTIVVDKENILNTLNAPAESNPTITKIDVVYSSDVMASTISDYVLTNDQIDVPKLYYANAVASKVTIVEDNRIAKKEVIYLVDAINILNLTFDSSDTTKKQASELTVDDVTGLEPDEIKQLAASAIISLKVSAILPSTCCETPTIAVFTATDKDDVEFTYKAAYNDEVEGLLLAMKAMNFSVDNTDTFDISSIDTELLREKLDESSIFHATMSKQITDNVTYVPYTYHYDKDTKTTVVEAMGTDEYLTSLEISSMVLALQKLGMTDTTATSQIDGAFLSSIDEDSIPDITKSAVIATIITTKIAGCTVPDSTLVQNTETLFKTDASSTMKVINQTELSALLKGILDLGITDISDTSTISIAGLDTTKFDADIQASYILRATISDKITDSVTSPTKDASGNDVFSAIGSTDYLIADEISAIIRSFKTINLEFDDISDIASIDIDKVSTNINALLQSATIHKLLSESMINQDVVTKTYYKDNDASNIFSVTSEVAETTYVSKVEVIYAIDGLNKLGVNADKASSIDQTYLSRINDSDVELIKQSAVLSKIFSKILIENKVPVLGIPYYQAIGAQMTPAQTFSTHMVMNAKDSSNVEILSQSDIDVILQNRNSI